MKKFLLFLLVSFISFTVFGQAPITGTFTVCVGSSTTLSDITPGGTWSSSNIVIASVGSLTGVVFGNSAGVVTITYSLGSAGFVVQNVTVNPLPGPITSTSTAGTVVCTGSTITLTDPTAGGTWTSGTPSVGTIDPVTGVVTGISPGTTIITYTLPTGCFASTIVVVNLTPGPITGPNQVCVGSTVNLTCAPAGGVWSSGSPTVATVGSGTGIVTGVSAGTAVITYTLSTGCFATYSVTVNPVPVIITGTTGIPGASVCVGGTVTLTGIPTGGVWTSGNPAIATVGSSSGVVTGISPGVVTITYTLSTGCFATTTVTVNPSPGAITGPTSVCVGSAINLTCTPGGGVWNSGSPLIATIGSSSGIVTGVSPGVSVITYTLPGGCFATYSVTVNPVPVIITGTTGIPGASVCVGGTVTLIGIPAGGTWTSGNPAIATVGSSSGVVTGISPGVVTITYTLSTGCFATTTVTVNPSPGAITGPTSVCVGSTINLTCTPGGGVWSSGSPLIATIGSSSGIVTGISPGVAVITYTLPGGCFATTTITVNPTPVIGTSGLVPQVCVGSSLTLSATPTGGVWTSGNLLIATVGSSSGVVTGISPGVVTITYTLSTGCFATVTITVFATPVITGPNVVCTGSTINLTGSPSGGIWSSSSPAIATVGSSSGVVTGISAGTAVITYMLSTGCFATTTITVNPTPVISTSGIVPRVCVGSSITLTATPTGGIWTSGNPLIATVGSASGVVTGITPGVVTITYTLPGGCFAAITITVNPTPVITGPNVVCVGLSILLTGTPGGGVWSSGSPAIATVGSSSGVVTGISAGTAVITYMLSTGCFATTTITVNPTPVISTSGIVPRVCVGSSITLTATPTGGIWTSGNPLIATVGSASGVVTGITPGVVTITYTLPGGCFAAITITVNPTPVISGPNVVCVGSNILLTGTPGGGVWSSGSPAIATVGSSSGVVTGVSAGTAVITYMLSTGCFATTTITVNPTPVISGTTVGTTLCVGSSITLTATPGGGVWTSSNTTVATVGSSSGIITAISPGAAVITYTLSTGCSASTVIIVVPAPSSITGITTVCVGGTTTLFCSGGGTWTSGSPGIATVGSSSGVVTGISVGTAVITYTLPSGCYATTTVNVVSIGPITGALTVCVGSTTVLAGPGGGTWSSGTPAVATVGPFSGIVTGVTAGTATITYMQSSGCFVTAVVTVNPLPGPIIGSGTACVGTTMTLSNSTPGGIWSSGNNSVATVGSSSGVVTGIAPGTTTIIYTLPTGCSVSTTITVNPSPGPIAAPAALCVGSTAVLTSTGGGVWSSSNPSVATIGAGSGIITGVTPGVVTISYTLPTGCAVTTVITINATPAPITGPAYVCLGHSITLSDITPGGVWTSSNPLIATVGSSSGVVTGVSVGNVTITYTLSNGCFVTFTLPVKPLPCTGVGVDEITAGNDALEVYPNPAYDELIVKTAEGVYSSYTITNQVGQVVMRNEVKGTQTTVPLKSLPAGLYYITVTGDGGSSVKKFVKM